MFRVAILSLTVCVLFTNSYSESSTVNETLNPSVIDTTSVLFSELKNKGSDYLTNLIITSKYQKLELFLNGKSIGHGSKTIKSIPYGAFTIDGRYEGKLLYNFTDKLEYPEASKKVEIEIENPYNNGVYYGVPSLIGAAIILGFYASGSSSNMGDRKVMLPVIAVPLIIIGIKGIKKQINHNRWENENRDAVKAVENEESN